MLDVSLIVADPEQVTQALRKRGIEVSLDRVIALDGEIRSAKTRIEDLRAQRNTISIDIGRNKGDDAGNESKRLRARELGAEIDAGQADIVRLESELQQILDQLPNLPDESVPAGGKASNVVIRQSGEPPAFAFESMDHVELGKGLGLIDHERGTKISGSGFWIYTGVGALLEWSLLNYFVAEHRRAGYEFVLLPHILKPETGYAAGQFPKFADEVFQVDASGDGRFLLPTAETAVVGLHCDETLREDQLPRKYFSYTPCYRREVGSYRASDRGTLRGHQFNKVEMFQVVTPEASEAAHEELVARAEQLVTGLELHYRVSLLAAEDTSASMAKTYDVEVWLPSLDRYLEVSSVSNAREYQARRGKIRVKGDRGRSRFVHTLNGSGLATSRLLPAILEQHQQPDGSVVVPEVLRESLGLDRLEPVVG